MALIHGDSALHKFAENLILLNLAQINGIEGVLSRIRDDLGGVYLWYRGFEIDESIINDSEKFVAYILREIEKKHCVEREARLAPAHKVILSADTIFSKNEDLEKWAKNPLFRQMLVNLLENSILFQQPLYIGKAANIYKRIGAHLKSGSHLRSRLNDAGHSIDRCKLLIHFLPSELSETESFIDNEELESIEESIMPSELLVEDILSRLFLPTFTVRYG